MATKEIEENKIIDFLVSNYHVDKDEVKTCFTDIRKIGYLTMTDLRYLSNNGIALTRILNVNDDEKELFKRLDPKGDPFYYAIKWKHFTYNRFINDFKSYIYK